MPVRVKKSNDRFFVADAGGGPKKGRIHETEEEAAAQARAINASLRRQGKI